MKPTLLGRKIGMTQVFDETGVVHGVTVIQLGPCQVMQVRTQDKDGYDAVQIGFEDKPKKQTTQAERGHAAKIGAEPKRFLREIRLSEPAEVEAGSMLTLDIFAEIKNVDVVGTMKGRGFAGVMKRHNFAGLEATHGVQRKHRAPGSIGSNQDPGRVRKGHKMNGQYGNTRVTVRNLKVFKIDVENGLMLLEGGIPGKNGGMVMVRQTNKIKLGAGV